MSLVYPWQDKSWEEFHRIYNRDNLPHAMILAGKEGTGLGHFVYALANSILCQNDRYACGHCKDCLLFQAGSHPDLYLVNNEENTKQIKVDQIRDLIDFISLKSFSGNEKIAIIDPADAMNRNASNTLLKTLEEPPGKSLLLLISYRPAMLPVTIRSRCQTVHIKPHINEQTLQWMESQLEENDTNIDNLLEIANGAPLLAIEMQNSEIMTMRNSILVELVELMEKKADPVEVAHHWNTIGIKITLEWLLQIFQEMIRFKVNGRNLEQARAVIKEHLQHHIKRLNLVQLSDSYDLVLKQYQLAQSPLNLNPLGLLEELTLYWCSRLAENGGNN